MNKLFLLPILMMVGGCNAVNHTIVEQPPVGVSPVTINSNVADIEITRAIRRSLVADPSLSIPGQNIIVTTNSGIVTLSGAVKDAHEKDDIHAKASVIPGISGIRNNMLQLAPTFSDGKNAPTQEL